MEQGFTELTLWIVPPGGTADDLKKIMALRRDEPHSSASYPVFEPHITLASVKSDTPIPLSIIRGSIPTAQPAIQTRFKSVDVGEHYFRSVYITINLDETLTDLHRIVHERLNMRPRTPKYPHVSLVYISDEDADGGERKKYFEELKARQLISVNGEEGVGLRPSVESRWIEGFLASEIWITKCVGPVETWEVLDKIPLKRA